MSLGDPPAVVIPAFLEEAHSLAVGGDYPAARALLEQNLGQVEEDSEAGVETLNLLGWCLSRLGENMEALEVATRAYERGKKDAGVDDPLTLDALNNVARFLFRCGDIEEALTHGLNVGQHREHVLGGSHEDTLVSWDNVAQYALAAGELEVARNANQKALRGWEHRGTVLDPQALTARRTEVEIAVATADDDAVMLAFRLLRDYDIVLGRDHPNTTLGRSVCGYALAHYGDPQGRAICENAYDAVVARLGADHLDTLTCGVRFAKALNALGDSDRADTIREALVACVYTRVPETHVTRLLRV